MRVQAGYVGLCPELDGASQGDTPSSRIAWDRFDSFKHHQSAGLNVRAFSRVQIPGPRPISDLEDVQAAELR
jgi:hypothetical protein